MEGRSCTKCERWKPPDAFAQNGTHPDGSPRLRGICRACNKTWRNEQVRTEDKTCTKCKQLKPATEFKENGRGSWCKRCCNEATYAYRRGPGRDAHNERMSQYQKDKYATDPVFRQKSAARAAVQRAVRDGALVRPSACPRCGRRVKLQAHHHKGYDKEHWLDVEWLCARCHFQEDKEAHT